LVAQGATKLAKKWGKKSPVIVAIKRAKFVLFVFYEHSTQARCCTTHPCAAVRTTRTHLREDGAIRSDGRVAHLCVSNPIGRNACSFGDILNRLTRV